MFNVTPLSEPLEIEGLAEKQNQLQTHLRESSSDGKTLPNMKGTNRALTNINCIDFENSDADEVVSDASIAPTGDWYVECFYYPDSHVSFAEVILANSNDQYIGTHSTSGRLRARVGATAFTTSVSNTIPTGEWSRIVSQRSGSNITFTVFEADGTQRWSETLSASSTAFATTTVKIGGIFSGRTIDGKIAHVKIGNSSTDIIAHYPLAEGSGTKVYDISGQGNHATSASVSYTTLNEIASNNHQYGFSVDSGVKIPALEDKTKQGYTGDGVADKIHFAHSLNSSSDWEAESEFIVNDPTVSLQAVFSATGNTGNDYGFFLRYEASSTRWLLKIGNGTAGTISSHSIARGDVYKFNLKYHSSTQKCTLTMTKNGTTTTPIDNVSVSNVPDFNGQAALGALRWSTSYANFTFKTCKFTQGTTSNVELDIEKSAGNSTVSDLSGNGNNGTLQSATLSLNWGKRYIDSNGIIVAASYSGGTSGETAVLTNPFGYVHNNSECSITLAGGSKTFSQLDAVNNATATELFVRKSNGLIHEIIEPKSAVSGTEKEVIKRYANH
tara:strand:- start:1398 stop:3065 length:1668 start_codon:yes stop_codon:yes gene_type:complete